ncbi:MAG: metallophosphoesterase [Bacteroidota bacterium]
MRTFFTFFLLFMISTAFSQKRNDCATETTLNVKVPEGPAPWSSLELNNNPCQFQFAIVTDRTGGHRPGVFMDGVRKLNLLQPEFVMSVGDLIEGYTEDVAQLDREWNEFTGFIDSLEMPFFYVPGNHDITNKTMETEYKKRFGQTYYHFTYKEVLFLCLNTEDQYRGSRRGTVSDEQYDYIEKTLAENEDVKWTLVFMHQPLWEQEDPKRWPDVEKLLAKRRHTVYAGHEHRYVQYKRNNGKYFILATMGGSSSLRGPELGEFDHVMWVTMTEQGPIMANLQLEGIWGEDVFTAESRTFVERFREKTPVRIAPFFVEAGAAAEGLVKIQLRNDENVSMHVHFAKGFSWDLEAELEQYEVVVEPNSMTFVNAKLLPRRWKALEDYDPMNIKADVWFEGAGVPKLKMPMSYNVGPLKKLTLPKQEAKVAIDGKLEEWPSLPYTIESDRAAEDISGAFAISYDDDFLYVAAHIRDDQIMVDTGTVTFRQDYVGVTFSADPLAESAMRTGSGWFVNSYAYIVSPATSNMPSTTFYEDRLAPEEQPTYQCVAVAGGYNLEMAIPTTYIEKHQGKDWQTIRFNLGVQDWDAGEEEQPRFSFMPNWRSKKHNVVGSGTFFRE